MKFLTMAKAVSLFFLLLMIGGMAYAQKSKKPTTVKLTMKTVRLRIDGFMKSKSGAV